MAPEYPPSLVIFDARFENGDLLGRLSYIEKADENTRLRVRWNVGMQPASFRAAGNGVVFVHDPDGQVIDFSPSDDAQPDVLGKDRYCWTEGIQSGHQWLMFVLILPASYTLLDPQP